MRLLSITLLTALLGTSLAGCSGDGTNEDLESLEGLKSISLEPADAVVELQAGQ
jgi:hypothetical protein